MYYLFIYIELEVHNVHEIMGVNGWYKKNDDIKNKIMVDWN